MPLDSRFSELNMRKVSYLDAFALYSAGSLAGTVEISCWLTIVSFSVEAHIFV